jgi:hypothetical protein
MQIAPQGNKEDKGFTWQAPEMDEEACGKLRRRSKRIGTGNGDNRAIQAIAPNQAMVAG